MSSDGGAVEWIDELAVRAGLPVGTIRLYQRDGLLPSGRRVGRSMTYGIAHLDRLARIQELGVLPPISFEGLVPLPSLH